MRLFVTWVVLAVAVLAVHASAWAGEAETTPAGDGKPTVDVVITFPGGAQMEGTLLQASPDGTLTVRTAGGTQEFRRQEWVSVQAKQRPDELHTAQGLLDRKNQEAYKLAAQNFRKAYDKYAHLYIFGAEALDGEARAQMAMKQYTKAVSSYKQLFNEYTGADLTADRRYNYAVALMAVGGKDNDAEAIAQLDRVVDSTDDVFTMKALNILGTLHSRNENYTLALRASLQVLILYSGYAGQDITAARAELKRAKNNALACCDKLDKSSSAEMKRRVAKIRVRVERLPF